METLPLGERLAMDKQWQAHWYRHLGSIATGKTVLDVGAGTGYGLTLLAACGAKAQGFDVAEINPLIPYGRIDQFEDLSFDYVSAVDVIEHVVDDEGMLRHMLRVARLGVFITTPNWNVSHAENPYHTREYTPVELQEFIAKFGFIQPSVDHQIWVSNHVLAITTRDKFDPDETWHNQAVLLRKQS
jgi:ubiquinone/menaquinone biosynthesis C-methylase UbiE